MPRGRPPVPIEIQKMRRRLCKKEIDAARVPIVLGDGKIAMPPEVKKSPVARAKWSALATLYKGTSYITSADTDIITRYCMESANYARLEALLGSGELEVRDWNSLDAALKRSAKMLLSYGDRLFLNPQVRVRGLPPPPPKEEKDEFDI